MVIIASFMAACLWIKFAIQYQMEFVEYLYFIPAGAILGALIGLVVASLILLVDRLLPLRARLYLKHLRLSESSKIPKMLLLASVILALIVAFL